MNNGARMEADVLRRFEAKVLKMPEGCWEWTASRASTGYGQLNVGGRPQLAHRLAFEHHKGTIPSGLQVDHTCRNRACVNPAHLEAVTSSENTRRGEALERRLATYAARTHCPQGHRWTEENTLVLRGARNCRACTADRTATRYWRRKGFSPEAARERALSRSRWRAQLPDR